jgi:hypothetical protein
MAFETVQYSATRYQSQDDHHINLERRENLMYREPNLVHKSTRPKILQNSNS